MVSEREGGRQWDGPSKRQVSEGIERVERRRNNEVCEEAGKDKDWKRDERVRDFDMDDVVGKWMRR